MSDIISVMRKMPYFVSAFGVPSEEIAYAEAMLQVTFATDYREYLKKLGVASFDGHELTGITQIARLNVVEVTFEEREKNISVPKDWYVLEQTDIDGIVLWQAPNGEIYQTSLGISARKIYVSLADMINSYMDL